MAQKKKQTKAAYSTEQKHAAVLEVLRGKTQAAAASAHGVSGGLISLWVKKFGAALALEHGLPAPGRRGNGKAAPPTNGKAADQARTAHPNLERARQALRDAGSVAAPMAMEQDNEIEMLRSALNRAVRERDALRVTLGILSREGIGE